MERKESKIRINKLKKEINHHRYLYHVEDRQEISDSALDSLKNELFNLEDKFPDLRTEDSPTQRIGGEPLKKFNKVRHITPMLSFNDAFCEEDLFEWKKRLENYLSRSIQNTEYYCELKIDGLAIELLYENGLLREGSTRGGGEIGEDVTQNLKTVEAIPLNLKSQISNLKTEIPAKLVVRGEVFLTKKEFERLNKELEKNGQKIYANPRNLAAGTIRQLDPRVAANRKLDSFEYSIVNNLGQKAHSDEHDLLKSLGFKTNKHNKICNGLEEVFAFRNFWEKHRHTLPYEVDGIVVIVNDNKTFNAAGVVGKAPRGAIAYKFSPKEATTIVNDIKIQVGRTGVLTPVAEMRPVNVGGVTISHASLHNIDVIKKLKLKIGDTVIVSRAGDVIPKITSVLTNLRTGKEIEFNMPQKCPIDGSRVFRIENEVAYKCSNKNCGARHKESIYHFVSRGGFNIEGLGIKIIDRFIDEGLISDASDIFSLKEGDISILERFGDKSANNIISEIKEKKEIALARLIYALGILHVGEETSRVLARTIDNLHLTINSPKHLLAAMKKMSLEQLQEIPDIGPKVAESITEWFKDKKHIELLRKLDTASVQIISPNSEVRSSKLAGLSFVLTGSLGSMSRDKAKETIRSLGGEISESVSNQTAYVIIGENPGSKAEKANKLGLKILSEKDFLKLLK